MPHFDANPLENLAYLIDEADHELSLSGLDHSAAIASVQTLLESANAGTSFVLRFDAATGDGSETLFQPLGRLLLQARRDGLLTRCLPLSNGAGYYIAFP